MDDITPSYVYHNNLGFYRVLSYIEEESIISATVTNGSKIECWVFREDDSSRMGPVVYLDRPPMRRKAARRLRRNRLEQ